jgi:hypothetical protein
MKKTRRKLAAWIVILSERSLALLNDIWATSPPGSRSLALAFTDREVFNEVSTVRAADEGGSQTI